MITAQWVCPCCWSEDLEYEDSEMESESMYYKWTCEKCWVQWEEWYDLTFSWQYNLLDKDWNEILLPDK